MTNALVIFMLGISCGLALAYCIIDYYRRKLVQQRRDMIEHLLGGRG